MSLDRRLAERVPLVRRKKKLYLEGVKAAASTELAPDDFLHQHYPPDEWSETLFAAMHRYRLEQTRWHSEKWRARRYHYGYRGYWAPPWKTLRIHLCADCGKAWYVAHYSVKRCADCERQHQQSRIRASNARMIARRAEQRTAERTAMACEYCGKPMTGRRLRRYCSAAHRQAAYRERAG